VGADDKGKKRKETGPFDALRALKEELSARERAAAAAKKDPDVAKKPAPAKATSAPARRTPDDPIDDDALLFHRMFSGVAPLDRSRGRVPRDRGERSDAESPPAGPASPQVARAEADDVRERLRELVEGGPRFEVADDGGRVEGRRVDLPIDALRRLRRGLMPIDAQIDLHGMRVTEARAQLELFLRTMRARKERCVLVVHGKGEHSPQGVGVLRGEMAAWLSQGASSQHVAAFASAAERDGGEGAIYVLLRR
jgi:DNA-nicking Smr family endonuclease